MTKHAEGSQKDNDFGKQAIHQRIKDVFDIDKKQRLYVKNKSC